MEPTVVGGVPVLGANEQPEHGDEGERLIVATPSDPEAAIDPAVALVAAWGRPWLDFPVWWAGIESMLSPAAQRVIALTDPEVIPVREVTGRGVLGTPTGTPYLVWVDVPTNAGTWSVLMSFDETSGVWVGESITQADEVPR